MTSLAKRVKSLESTVRWLQFSIIFLSVGLGLLAYGFGDFARADAEYDNQQTRAINAIVDALEQIEQPVRINCDAHEENGTLVIDCGSLDDYAGEDVEVQLT